MSYPWSGNVRELEHTISRAIILTAGKGLIRLKDLKLPSGLPEKMVEETDHLADIQKELIQTRVNSRQKEILKLMVEKGPVSTQQLKQLFKVSEQQIRKDLKLLLRKNFIDKIGTTKGSYYVLRE